MSHVQNCGADLEGVFNSGHSNQGAPGPGVVAHSFNPSTRRQGQANLLRVQGQPGLYSKFWASLGYVERSCLKAKKCHRSHPRSLRGSEVHVAREPVLLFRLV